MEKNLRQRIARETPDEEGVMLVKEISILRFGVIADLQSLNNGFNQLAEHTGRTGIDHSAMMAGLIDDIAQRLQALRTHFDLPEHELHDPRPGWLSGNADEYFERPVHLRGNNTEDK